MPQAAPLISECECCACPSFARVFVADVSRVRKFAKYLSFHVMPDINQCHCLFLHMMDILNYGLMSVLWNVAASAPALGFSYCDLVKSRPSINFWTHNPQSSRSIIYNVITVGLIGPSSCSPLYVASIRFWLVNDCLFFAGHMESAVYSLSLHSHWLTLTTDVGTVIVAYCCLHPGILQHTRKPCPNGCNLLFFPRITVNLLYSADQKWSLNLVMN